MQKIKSLIIVVILFVLLVACQTNPTNIQTDAPGAGPYPYPGETSVVQETAYPAPEDNPVTQETAYPYPETDNDQAGPISDPAYVPKPEDANLETGNVFLNLEDSGFLLLESYPVQVKLALHGELPTPCHQLRVKVSPPDSENRILVETYSVVDPNMMCIQVIEPFDTQVALGSFESGKYTIYINGEYLGEFTI